MSHHEDLPTGQVNGFPVEDYERLIVSAFPGEPIDFPVLGATDDIEIAPSLTAFLQDPQLIVASIQEDGRLIGCSLAIPIDRMDPQRAAEANETAYIYYTAIEPDKQGQGRIGPLSDLLFARLAERGFTYVEQDAVHDNGYHKKILKNYRQSIIETSTHNKFAYGPQQFFRIRLGELAVGDQTDAK